MPIKDELPHLGQVQDDGTVTINCSDVDICIPDLSRPNYEAFKEKPDFKSELDCVSVLIGCNAQELWQKIKRREKRFLNKINTRVESLACPTIKTFGDGNLLALCDEIGNFLEDAMLPDGHGGFKEINREVKNACHEPIDAIADDYTQLVTKIEHIDNKGFSELSSLLLEIGMCLKIGRSKKALEGDWCDPETENISYHSSQLFKTSTIYHTPTFLDWMQQNGFPIPPELNFGKMDDGTLCLVTNNERAAYKDKYTSDPDYTPLTKTADLNWTGITITFLNDDDVLIQFKDKGIQKDYRQIGFEDRRSHRPNKAWKIFKTASQQGGIVKYTTSSRPTIEKRIQELRKKLKKLFPGIPEGPILHQSDRYKFIIHLKNNIID